MKKLSSFVLSLVLLFGSHAMAAPTKVDKPQSRDMAELAYKTLVETDSNDSTRAALRATVSALLAEGDGLIETIHPIQPPTGEVFRSISLVATPAFNTYRLTATYRSGVTIEVEFYAIFFAKPLAIDPHPVIFSFKLSSGPVAIPVPGVGAGTRSRG